MERAVPECDADALEPHVVTELLKVIPTSDEIHGLQLLTVDHFSLTPTEHFMWDLSQTDRDSDRFRALHNGCLSQGWNDIMVMPSNWWIYGLRHPQKSNRQEKFGCYCKACWPLAIIWIRGLQVEHMVSSWKLC